MNFKCNIMKWHLLYNVIMYIYVTSFFYFYDKNI